MVWGNTKTGICACLLLTICMAQADSVENRTVFLKQLKDFVPKGIESDRTVSPIDKDWISWQMRTGELPPDFNSMPSIPFLPEPLILDEGGANVPIKTIEQWQEKTKQIKENISFILGNEPDLISPDIQADAMRDVTNLNWPEIKTAHVTKDILFGRLYMPQDKGNCPAIIYLHEYAHTTGCVRGKADMIDELVRKGFAVYIFDQIGYGTRIIEGQYFYMRWPKWSKMGRAISDVRFVVDELSKVEAIDSKKIFTAGYALGATVALYSAAMDDRIAGVVSVCGFTPLRTSGKNKDIEGIKAYSHLHGLIPRLGFFIGHETRLPVDFDEIIASIAPRPVTIISPEFDHDADIADIKKCCENINKVYQLLGADGKFKCCYPYYYNRFYGVVMEDFCKALDEIK